MQSFSLCRSVWVSIHAPVRGATTATGLRRLLLLVSIHAPVRGATGADWDNDVTHEVSIHAPVRGATQKAVFESPRDMFQSTPLCEGRLRDSILTAKVEGFNPRPCARGDLTTDLTTQKS